MRTAKLNKSQNWTNVLEAITDVVNNTNTLKKNQEEVLESELINALSVLLAPKQGGGSSTKINESGEVYCNYFEKYLPADDFNTKMGKPNKETGVRTEGYKASSKDAEVIIRKVKVLRYKVEKQVIANFKDQTISADEMNDILVKMEVTLADKIQFLEDVPTVAHIVGLTTDEPAEEQEYEDLMALADEVEEQE